MNIDFTNFYSLLNPVFWDFFDNKYRIRISYGGAGSGKCLAKGTNVIMYSGELKPVEEIRPGDKLMGIDSTPRIVIECHNGYGDLYIVKQNKGMNYVVNENHILSLKKSCHLKKDRGELMKSGNYRRKNGVYPDYPEILNIGIKDFIKKSKKFQRYFRGYRSKIEFNKKKVILDPYFLGIWLGDGHSHKPTITTIDEEIVNFLYDFKEKNGYNISEYQKKDNLAKTYSFVGKKEKNSFKYSENKLTSILKSYNLIKNKHIPDDFLYNSRTIRLQLLAGLLDTDGYLFGNCYNIIQKNKKLSYQIQFLASSLGFRASVVKKKKHCMVNNKKFTGEYWDISISGDVQIIPTKIKRKQITKYNKNKDSFITGINIESFGQGEYFGFSLDGDHLFMLEDCTVVHNSFAAFQEMICKVIVEPGHNYLVCRKVANTNKNSTYSLTKQIISLFNAHSIFKENKSDMTFTCKHNGNMIVFKGLDDIEKIKSMTFPNGVLTDILIEEASETFQSDFDQLNVRLRGQALVPFQITMLLNPISDQHWIKREFFDLMTYQKKYKVFILKTTYKHNLYIDESYKEILEGYADIDYEFYKVYCLGEWGAYGNLIFTNWMSMSCPYKENEFDAIYNGQDYGFEHPSVIVKIGFKDGNMYSYNELCCEKKTNMEFIQLNKEFDILHPGEAARADSAEPARIREWQQNGYGILPAIKGPDSVSRGIDFLKSQKWFIDPDKCPRTLQEVQVYHRKTDKNGNVDHKENPVDIFDDAIKATMYAVELLSRNQGPAGVLSGTVNDQKKELIKVKAEQRRKFKEILKARRQAKKEIDKN